MVKICCLNDFDFQNIEHDLGATIYISIDGKAFPNKDWFDLPISIFCMWTSCIIRNYKSDISKFKLFFMDGPYYIDCSKSCNMLHMKFIESRKRKTTVYEQNVIFNNFVSEIINESIKMINTAEGKIGSNYLQELEQNINTLQELSAT
jgi:hypothetical protein